ncbi:hypothetical protein C2U35_12155 [Ralstonia solanacearum]|nr:hypothetical protein C2U35_12155 [Ralstonia solanacearum]
MPRRGAARLAPAGTAAAHALAAALARDRLLARGCGGDGHRGRGGDRPEPAAGAATARSPRRQRVAVLQDAQAQAAVLVTWDARTGTLSLKRLDATPLTSQQALQLWALPPDGHPRSLGVIGHQRAMRLMPAQPLARVPALAVSVEPRGGSPDPNGPTGPVIFKGRADRQRAVAGPWSAGLAMGRRTI